MSETYFPTIYQLKVVLMDISAMIWRRLLVSGDCTITDLHYILQIAMGWSDDHLNRFRIHGIQYGVYHDGGMVFSHDPDEVRLGDFQFRINEKFLYEYDFTDQWRHQIRVENILDFDPRKYYPLCIGGNRACPPEDSGGPWRFMALRQHYSLTEIMERLFEIIEDEVPVDHVEELHTLRYWLSVNRFDRKTVNKRLYDHARGENVFMWV
jgi:hypothetical protein